MVTNFINFVLLFFSNWALP